jgi:beta-galactosidase
MMSIMVKRILIFFSVLLLTVSCFAANIHKEKSIERRELFDNNWKFALGDYPSANKIDFDDKIWREINLPHDWSIQREIDKNNPTGQAGGYFPAGIGWYRKNFIVPSSWQGKKVSIYFEGVYMNSEVFINGRSLGVHPYGYTSFCYDLTPFLNYNKENIIAVRVDNSQQINSRWYSGSGIYRHVWLFVTNPIHFSQWVTVITTPEITAKKSTVQIKSIIKNKTAKPQSIVLSTKIFNKKNNTVGNNELKIDLPAESEKEIEQSIIVNNPLLWAPENPNLYNAQMEIIQDNKTVDLTQNSFGIKSLKFSAENGFQLNGKTVKINGGCAHHDNGCLGAAAYDRAEERKVELIKSAGFNTVRTSHNPPSEAFLNACDRLGIMVIDESFDCWRESKNAYDYARFFDKWWQRDLESMVKRDINHPSIIMWSTGNEIIERKKPEAVETAKMLADCIHKLDKTRPVTSAMTTWDNDWKIFDPLMAAHDVCGYNYQMLRAPSDHERVPSRIILQTESYPKDAFYNWDMVQNHNYIIGDVVWTALDYLGESGIGRYYYPGEPEGEHWQQDFFPWHGAYCGDIDLTGWRKPISHYRNILWNNAEKLYISVKEPNPDNGEIKLTEWAVWPTWESWTWNGHEGKDIQVEVYSRYPSVRLYLNDKLIGELPTTKEQGFKTIFTIPYSPGTLKAAGVQDDKEIESTILRTAGKAAEIKLIADRSVIKANGQDLSFVTVEITDKYGNIQPNANNMLSFKIEGPGVIAGVDNANLKNVEKYVGNTRTAWHGRAMVIIKSTNDPGNILLNVNSPGIKTASISINTSER